MDFIPFKNDEYEEEYFLEAKMPIKFLNTMMGYKSKYIFGLINIVGGEKETPLHIDPRDVCSWHCINTIDWEFSDSHDGDRLSLTLKPGDLLYIPAGNYHKCYPLSKRLSISICFNNKEDNLIFISSYSVIKIILSHKQPVSMYEQLGFSKIKQPLGNSGHCGCDIWMTKSL